MPEFGLQLRETISELHKSNGLMGLLMQRDYSSHPGLAVLQSVFEKKVGIREFACVLVRAHNV